MTKQEYIRILMLLSQLEGYVIAKVGDMFPSSISEEVSEVCDLLAKKIGEDK